MICDVCGRSEVLVPIEEYEIRWPEGRARFDLCVDDAGPVRALIDRAPSARTGPTRKLTRDTLVSDPSEVPVVEHRSRE